MLLLLLGVGEVSMASCSLGSILQGTRLAKQMEHLWASRHLLIRTCTEGSDQTALSAEEEADLRTFHESKIIDVCTHFKFDLQVLTAAILLHKRFYLKRSMLQGKDPKHIMLACIFLGTKVGNLHLEASFITGKVAGSDPKVVLELEFHVLSNVGFNLDFPPLDAVFRGLFLFFGSLLPQVQVQRVEEQIFPAVIHRILLSDLLLAYPVKKVALAVTLHWIEKEFGNEVLELAVDKVINHVPDFERELMYQIIKHLDSFKLQTQQKCKETMEKLRIYCGN